MLHIYKGLSDHRDIAVLIRDSRVGKILYFRVSKGESLKN